MIRGEIAEWEFKFKLNVTTEKDFPPSGYDVKE